MHGETTPADGRPSSERGVDINIRKLYMAPRLIVHGTLEKITGNVGNGFLDFPQGSSIAG